jgi:PAS domain S-box-containing protein
MLELNEYDNAISRYSSSIKFNTLPLISWDIYCDFLSNFSGNLIDSKKLQTISFENQWDWSLDFQKELDEETVIVVTDPKLRIVFSSQNMIKMNGYKQNEVIGMSPKMFQGKDTSEKTSQKISKAVRLLQPFEEIILNYRKNGEPYKCLIKGYPIFNGKGVLTNYIALEKSA